MANDDDDVLTITMPDTITLGDTLYTASSDIDLSWADGASGDTVTVSGIDDIDWSTYTFTDTLNTSVPSITLGNTTLEEADLKKLKALLDVIEGLDNNNDLKQMLKGQIALNEIGKE